MKKKAKDIISKKSTLSETKEGSDLPPVKVKQITQANTKNKQNGGIKILPEVTRSPHVANKNKMTSIERIAKRLELESKKKPLMNIDKEYSNLQKILDRKQMDYEKESGRVSGFIIFE